MGKMKNLFKKDKVRGAIEWVALIVFYSCFLLFAYWAVDRGLDSILF